MNKISKKDQDPRQSDKDRAALNKLADKPSQHFAVGTFVVWERHRYLIDRYEGDTVYLSDGGLVVPLKNPYFMR